MNKLALPLFKRYNIHPKILEVLEIKGLHTATPVQDLMFTTNSKNNLLIGPTGTGKTYAYMIPTLSQLKWEEENLKMQLTHPQKIRGLVIVPSKELVIQTTNVSKEFSRPLMLTTRGLCYEVKTETQLLRTKGIDLVITTIERLKKHRSLENIYLSGVSHFIVDEIDTLLDAEYGQEIKYLCEYFQKYGKQTNTTFCGATCNQKVEKFCDQVFHKEMKFLIEKKTHHHLENLEHEFIHCTTLDKADPLSGLLKETSSKGQTIIFCNSIQSCHYVKHFLQNNGYKLTTLHGDVPKMVRVQNVEDFRHKRVPILVATDLAARGLDFPEVCTIINFDFPTSTSDYLHRAGRAGRAGRKGFVYSLYHSKEQKIIEALRQANETQQPIKIDESAYSKINKESIEEVRKQERSKRKTAKFTKQGRRRSVLGYKPASKQKKQERTSKRPFREKYEKEK